MIEPVKSHVPGVAASEATMWRFGDLGYVSVYADGHARFVAYAGTTITHAVNSSDRPGEHVLTVRQEN